MDFSTVVDSQYVEISQYINGRQMNTQNYADEYKVHLNYLVNTVTKLFKL